MAEGFKDRRKMFEQISKEQNGGPAPSLAPKPLLKPRNPQKSTVNSATITPKPTNVAATNSRAPSLASKPARFQKDLPENSLQKSPVATGPANNRFNKTPMQTGVKPSFNVAKKPISNVKPAYLQAKTKEPNNTIQKFPKQIKLVESKENKEELEQTEEKKIPKDKQVPKLEMIKRGSSVIANTPPIEISPRPVINSRSKEISEPEEQEVHEETEKQEVHEETEEEAAISNFEEESHNVEETETRAPDETQEEEESEQIVDRKITPQDDSPPEIEEKVTTDNDPEPEPHSITDGDSSNTVNSRPNEINKKTTKPIITQWIKNDNETDMKPVVQPLPATIKQSQNEMSGKENEAASKTVLQSKNSVKAASKSKINRHIVDDKIYDDDDNLEEEDWYSSISKDESSKIMKTTSKGNYLVRPSSNKTYVLMVRISDVTIKKFKISSYQSGWVLGESHSSKKIHASIGSLMKYYIKNGIKCGDDMFTLKNPANK